MKDFSFSKQELDLLANFICLRRIQAQLFHCAILIGNAGFNGLFTCRFNTWIPVSYFDENNNFRGQAVFEDYFKALKYMHKYEDRLIENHLKESKRFSNDNQRHLNAAELKLFLEYEIPNIRTYR